MEGITGGQKCLCFIYSIIVRKKNCKSALPGCGLEIIHSEPRLFLGFTLLKLPCLLRLISSPCLDKHQLPRTKTIPVGWVYEWQRAERQRGLETEPRSAPEAKEAGDRGVLRGLNGDTGIRIECGVLLSIKLLSGVIKACLLGT